MMTKPPLTEDDYAAVRRSVMTKIAAQESRRTWLVRGMQLGFAMLAIAILTVWLTKSRNEPTIVITPKRATQIAQTSSNPATQQLPHRAIQQPSNLATQQLSNLSTQQPATSVTLRPRDHAIHHTAKRRQPKTPESPPEPMRIQLATNDPDIRIIWITNPNESR